MACAAAALVIGCSTTSEDNEAQGRPLGEPDRYEGSSRGDLHPGVNTNYFGPVNYGPEAAHGVGTPSGGTY